jgi:hypothetical protein
MSNKIHQARCCGCGSHIDVNGIRLRGNADGDFFNMSQVREAAKNHRWFCTNYTGGFVVTANWYVEVEA